MISMRSPIPLLLKLQTQVVGVVRIYELQPRLWYGGRLGVHVDHRRAGKVGKGLIHQAVTTAHGWGCDRFLATVQSSKRALFPAVALDISRRSAFMWITPFPHGSRS